MQFFLNINNNYGNKPKTNKTYLTLPLLLFISRGAECRTSGYLYGARISISCNPDLNTKFKNGSKMKVVDSSAVC